MSHHLTRFTTRARLGRTAVLLAVCGLTIPLAAAASAHGATTQPDDRPTVAQPPTAAGSADTSSNHPAVKPTIVLVHGAWADASSWNGEISRLQRDGYTVYAPPNPLRGLATDAATVADFVRTIPGPVVLVGHSYGGFVITNAATQVNNVKALVYDDAYQPAKGETVFQINAAKPGSCVNNPDPTTFLNFVPYPGAPAGDVDAYLKIAPTSSYPGFDACFANGVNHATAALLAAGQRPFAVSAGSAPSGAPAWATTPSWAVVGTQDHVIPPAEQLAMAHRADSHITTVNAGHLSLVSNPDCVTAVIEQAARSTH